MKDLFVLTADSDMQALVREVLGRHRDLQIRPIRFEVERYTGRDAGMVKDGPEFARMRVQKTEFHRSDFDLGPPWQWLAYTNARRRARENPATPRRSHVG
jgi:hypothetical protein